MTIDFSNLELDEETRAQLDGVMKNEIVSTYLTESLKNREEAVRQSAKADADKLKSKVDEFRETNITQQKKLEQFEAIDLDEYARLKALGSDVASAAEKIKNNDIEWQAKLDGQMSKVAEYEKMVAQLEQDREKDRVTSSIRESISEWNMKNPQLKIKDGAERVIVGDALSSYKLLDDKIVMQADGIDYTTDQGFGSITDWIGDVARKQNPFCFTELKGSGASGNTSSGVATKPVSEMTGAEQLKFRRDNPDEFYRQINKG
jgi:hypothetical protein